MQELLDDLALLGAGLLTRRQSLQGLIAILGRAALATSAGTRATVKRCTGRSAAAALPDATAPLPVGIRSRQVTGVNGLTVHVLESGFETKNRPAIILLHGFPELAYSWRNVMLPLASNGFHVIAPDRRGYGRTSDSLVRFDDDLTPYRTLNQVTDIVALVSAFGYRSVEAVIGHDQGSPIAAWCSLVRPDVFRSVVMMSAPFAGPPALPFETVDSSQAGPTGDMGVDHIYEDLAALNPPRKYYQQYYMTREANDNMWHARQGIHAFLRAYYHMKSADWKQNAPFPLKARTATELAKLPRYYVMDIDKGMAETVAPEMPSPAAIAACKWLPDDELSVYSAEFGRTGFQGGLDGYRVGGDAKNTADLRLFSGRTIDVPSLFIAGKSDWGPYQSPGSLEKMQKTACTQMRGVHLVDGSGHWAQQEQPDAVSKLLLQFLHDAAQHGN